MSEVLDFGKAVNLEVLLNKQEDDKAKQLPKPSGYKILCAKIGRAHV